MKIRPVGVELFYSGWGTDRRDEANSRFTQFSYSEIKLTSYTMTQTSRHNFPSRH
jgi:hypothetical protein